MWIKQTMPLYSFYKWDDSLFDLLEVPEGIDKEKLIDNILLDAGERSVIYSDPDFLKKAIGIWSNTYQATFERWANALAIEYDPLENYDRTENWTDNGTHSGQTQTSTTDSQTTGQTSGGTNTESGVAYPDNAWHDTKKSVDSGSLSINVSGTGSGTGSESSTDANTHAGRVHGNIGVTTSQQMLQAELDLGYWNIIAKITDLFIENFIIIYDPQGSPKIWNRIGILGIKV